jgi:hypothetical protein
MHALKLRTWLRGRVPLPPSGAAHGHKDSNGVAVLTPPRLLGATLVFVLAQSATAEVKADAIVEEPTQGFTVSSVSGPATFHALTSPCRAVDTRSPFSYPVSNGGRMNAGETRSFALPTSSCGIPSNATAYSLNATVVPNGPLGYLTLWPALQTQPLVSTLNSPDGRIKANAAIVPAGWAGAISAYVTNATDLIIDVNGYFAPSGSAGELAFYTVNPCRISDTRRAPGGNGGPVMYAGETRAIDMFYKPDCGFIPGPPVFSLNYTAVPQSQLSYLTTWPGGESQPVVSTLNSPTGTVVANAAIVRIGSSTGYEFGPINIFVTDTTDVVVDVNGYFSWTGMYGALSFYAVTPCRISDTRLAAGPFGGPRMAAGETRTYIVPQSSCSIPYSASAYSLNVTVVPDGPLGYITLWATGVAQSTVSTLNAWDGFVTSNAAIVAAGVKCVFGACVGGAINVFSTNLTHVIIDINGYFAP